MLIFGEECEKAAVRSSKSLGECVWVEDQEEPPPQLTQFQARFSYAPVYFMILYDNDTLYIHIILN